VCVCVCACVRKFAFVYVCILACITGGDRGWEAMSCV